MTKHFTHQPSPNNSKVIVSDHACPPSQAFGWTGPKPHSGHRHTFQTGWRIHEDFAGNVHVSRLLCQTFPDVLQVLHAGALHVQPRYLPHSTKTREESERSGRGGQKNLGLPLKPAFGQKACGRERSHQRHARFSGSTITQVGS